MLSYILYREKQTGKKLSVLLVSEISDKMKNAISSFLTHMNIMHHFNDTSSEKRSSYPRFMLNVNGRKANPIELHIGSHVAVDESGVLNVLYAEQIGRFYVADDLYEPPESRLHIPIGKEILEVLKDIRVYLKIMASGAVLVDERDEDNHVEK